MSQCRNWIKSQFQASYKGVPFEVRDDAREFGRRNATHQYPGAETWDVEDMGVGMKTIHVIGYVFGDFADIHVAQLEAACSSPGPGLLVLPNRPAVMAHANPCVSNWREDQQGLYEVHLEFIEKPFGIGGLFSIVFLAGAVSASITVGVGAATGLFSLRFDSVMQRFSPLNYVPACARDAAAETIDLAADAVERASRMVVLSDAKAGAEIESLLRQMKVDRFALAFQGQKPNRIEAEVFVADEEDIKSGFAGNLAAIFAKLAKASTKPDAMARAMLQLLSFEAQEIDNPYDALSVRAEKALTAEVAFLVKRLALLYLADAMANQSYPARADAITARADLAEAFDEAIGEMDHIATENAFTEVRNMAVKYLSQTAAELPAIIWIDSAKPMPAAVLATILYNDASRDLELAERNHAANPLFMPLHVQAVAVEANRRG